MLWGGQTTTMAEETSLPQLSIDTQLKTDQKTPSPSIRHNIELDKSGSSGSIPRRSSRVPNSASHNSPTTNEQRRRCARPKSVSLGPQNSPSQGSAAGAGATPRASSRTPKMKRVSKAKKGKKVHECDFGCGKVRAKDLNDYDGTLSFY